MRFRLRFWAENISPPEILRYGLPLLKEFSAGVGVALFGDSMTDENARALHNLEGVLSRGNPRRWFEAVRGARPRVPPRSVKIALAVAAGRNIYPLLGRLARSFS